MKLNFLKKILETVKQDPENTINIRRKQKGSKKLLNNLFPLNLSDIMPGVFKFSTDNKGDNLNNLEHFQENHQQENLPGCYSWI